MVIESKKSENYIQLKKFLIDTGLIKHGTIINNIQAIVEYRYADAVEKFEAAVSFTMEGVNSCGDVTIDSTELPENKYHTGFKTAFQTYKYDAASNSLIIEGNSTKMKGIYEVIITPNQ